MLNRNVSQTNSKEVENIIKERNIEHLLHFTNIRNLESILHYGIVPVKYHNELGINAITNDTQRVDQILDATSFSVEFPNYKMFYKLRMEDKEQEWVVIFVKADVLTKKQSIYCYDNASNPEIRSISVEERKSHRMFKEMFNDIASYPRREESNLKRYYPTSPQAEILIVEIIEIDYIDKIVFLDSKTKGKYSSMIPKQIKSEVIPEYFYAREDFKFFNE